jgi:hypothetical protein
LQSLLGAGISSAPESDIMKALTLVALMLASGVSVAATAQDQARLERLSAAEIRSALSGTRVSYAPPRSGDMGVQEEYGVDGGWTGIIYGRAPLPFSGQWKVENDELCVHTERGSARRASTGWFCRVVWRDDTSGNLLMDHLTSAVGLQDLKMIPPASPGR